MHFTSRTRVSKKNDWDYHRLPSKVETTLQNTRGDCDCVVCVLSVSRTVGGEFQYSISVFAVYGQVEFKLKEPEWTSEHEMTTSFHADCLNRRLCDSMDSIAIALQDCGCLSRRWLAASAVVVVANVFVTTFLSLTTPIARYLKRFFYPG